MSLLAISSQPRRHASSSVESPPPRRDLAWPGNTEVPPAVRQAATEYLAEQTKNFPGSVVAAEGIKSKDAGLAYVVSVVVDSPSRPPFRAALVVNTDGTQIAELQDKTLPEGAASENEVREHIAAFHHLLQQGFGGAVVYRPNYEPRIQNGIPVGYTVSALVKPLDEEAPAFRIVVDMGLDGRLVSETRSLPGATDVFEP
jgi:hypothetical protein